MRSPMILQTIGWALLIAIDFTLNRAANPSDPLGQALYVSTSFGVMGYLVSTPLLWLYRRALPTGPAALGSLALTGALVSSLLWYLALHGLHLLIDPGATVPVLSGLFNLGMLCFFIMLAWHGVLLTLRASARAANAEKLAQEAQLMALRYQLSPHFLFNVLNSAIALVDEDPKRAQTMLTLLSRLLRETLEGGAESETSLDRELQIIERYVEIQRVRFEDKLQVDMEVADSARTCAIPPLLLHTLLENAVKHGFETATSMPLHVRLSASYEHSTLKLAVSNNGSLAPGHESGEGLGLRNLSARLQARYPGRHHFEIVERNGLVLASMEIRAPRLLVA